MINGFMTFDADLFEVNVDLRKPSLTLKTYLYLKVNFYKETYESFWTQQKQLQKYPLISEEIRVLFISFPSSGI